MRMWLKEVRLQKDLTQEQTAIKSNISRSYYTHIESGVKNPTVETAKDIAFALEFEWTNFFENQRSLKEQKAYKEMM
ncbi:helix-turn-helix transcriptional regulator [Halobacillus amylolyticus]|uniref:Helix-turn-helix domain-containing protein n=1 Tax=Halobacillus amylolyticus TaxID=2932259 RepID=A0ABY4H606_9BACI|nr:helix-turn-helix transcriptional regulator [Halobacillus amylolyticus]UOR10285.1 helix-turn-helix domain-containing protein [Halobacillus amylolyticus]